MWVVDLIIEAQKRKQQKEQKLQWHLDIGRFLKKQNERRIKQKAENIKRKL